MPAGIIISLFCLENYYEGNSISDHPIEFVTHHLKVLLKLLQVLPLSMT